MASRSVRNSQSSGQRTERSVATRMSLAGNASSAKRFFGRSASVVSIPGRVIGNNRYGNKGTLKCFDCRRLKRRCDYDNPEDPCEHCLARNVPCGEKQRSENQVGPAVPPTPAPVESPSEEPQSSPRWARDEAFLPKIMDHVDEKLSVYDVIDKIMDEIAKFMEENPQESARPELFEKLRALTPESHGDAPMMSQPEQTPMQMSWQEQPMQFHNQYQPTSGTLHPSTTYSFVNPFPGLQNPMGQQQNFDMHAHNQLQSLVQIPGASLPRGPTLTGALSVDPQYLNHFPHNPFRAEPPRIAPQGYPAQFMQSPSIKMEVEDKNMDWMRG